MKVRCWRSDRKFCARCADPSVPLPEYATAGAAGAGTCAPTWPKPDRMQGLCSTPATDQHRADTGLGWRSPRDTRWQVRPPLGSCVANMPSACPKQFPARSTATIAGPLARDPREFRRRPPYRNPPWAAHRASGDRAGVQAGFAEVEYARRDGCAAWAASARPGSVDAVRLRHGRGALGDRRGDEGAGAGAALLAGAALRRGSGPFRSCCPDGHTAPVKQREARPALWLIFGAFVLLALA